MSRGGSQLGQSKMEEFSVLFPCDPAMNRLPKSRHDLKMYDIHAAHMLSGLLSKIVTAATA